MEDSRWLLQAKELKRIASEVMHSNHGDFLKTFAEAYIRADLQNKEILKAAWMALIKKYGLDEEYKQT